MSNQTATVDIVDQYNQIEYAFRTAQQRMAATNQWRTGGPGYILDEAAEVYHLTCNGYAQAKDQYDEARQRRVTLDRTQRKPVLKLIDKLKGCSTQDTASGISSIKKLKN